MAFYSFARLQLRALLALLKQQGAVPSWRTSEAQLRPVVHLTSVTNLGLRVQGKTQRWRRGRDEVKPEEEHQRMKCLSLRNPKA